MELLIGYDLAQTSPKPQDSDQKLRFDKYATDRINTKFMMANGRHRKIFDGHQRAWQPFFSFNGESK